MKAIIVDDSEYKRTRIKDYIISIDADIEIIEFECYIDAARFIASTRENKEKAKEYMLFLDWMFPLRKDSSIEENGRMMLEEINRLRLPLKTIIVSSDKVNIADEYPFLIGSIIDDVSVYQKKQYADFINKFKEDLNEERSNSCGQQDVQ